MTAGMHPEFKETVGSTDRCSTRDAHLICDLRIFSVQALFTVKS